MQLRRNRTCEQKLALEISTAKRECDFYLSKVDQSRALSSMQERAKKVCLVLVCFLMQYGFSRVLLKLTIFI